MKMPIKEKTILNPLSSLSYRLEYWFINYTFTKVYQLAFYIYTINGKELMSGQSDEDNRLEDAEYIVPDTQMDFIKNVVREIIKRQQNL